MDGETRPSFYDAISEQVCVVSLGRVSTVIRKPKVRQFILYKERLRLLQDALKGFDKVTTTALFADWLEVVVGFDGLANILPDEVAALVSAVDQLYLDPPLMEWQKPLEVQPGTKPRPSDDVFIQDNLQYDGRSYSFVVSLVCRLYGWTPKYILDELTMYELSIYAQEAMLFQHQDQEFQYNLSSDIGFKKVGDSYVKIPYPTLPWVKRYFHHPDVPEKRTPLPLKYLPGGGQEVWKPGEGLVSKSDPEGEVLGMRLNPETGKVETYAIKWAAVQYPPTGQEPPSANPPSPRGYGIGQL